MSTQEENRDRADHALEQGTLAATQLDTSLERKTSPGQVWKIALVVSAFAVAASLGLSSVATQSIVELKANQVASDKARTEESETTRKAIEQLREANADLAARGQRPVEQPPDLNTGDTLVAAATARVLANLPPTPAPNDQQIGQVMAAYFANNPVTVSPQRIANQVANYFAENPVEPGEQGEQGERGEQGEQGKPGVDGKDGKDGEPGRTPTPDEIMAVFNATAAQNPNILCAGRGTFTEVAGIVRVPPENLPSERTFWVCLPE